MKDAPTARMQLEGRGVMRTPLRCAMTACLLVVMSTTVHAHGGYDRHKGRDPRHGGWRPERVEADGEACRDLQRKVQEAVAERRGRRGKFGETVREVARILHTSRAARDESCRGCIVRELVRTRDVSEQAPCGTHDVCLVGDPLERDGDECTADVCAVRASCCRKRWDADCVGLAVGICAIDCDACSHDACTEGRALPGDCNDCTARVCESDPYCCDTRWDERCVERATTACDLKCSAATTTTSTTTTTTTTMSPTTTAPAPKNTTTTTHSPSTTTTTVPECARDADCSDGNACTVDACAGGVCTFAARSCDDADACSVDTSDPAAGCQYSAVLCNDVDACTLDTCDAAGGCRTSPLVCDDANPCTNDSCDSALGCRFAARSCDDANPCTVDSCNAAAGGCVATPLAGCRPCADASQCGDAKVCTDDVCTAAGTCSNPKNRASCDDGNLCTVGDRCLNGSCIGGPIMNCNDGDPCTIDACSAGACINAPKGCSDGNACTTDFCDVSGGCGHQTASCDDANPCTTDTCDTVQGCRHAPVPGCTP
jgi:hypothetical protein